MSAEIMASMSSAEETMESPNSNLTGVRGVSLKEGQAGQGCKHSVTSDLGVSLLGSVMAE